MIKFNQLKVHQFHQRGLKNREGAN
ncbi:Uncharacterized protein APZ42_018438 [Daphnia magna]|uniref:Uncharacterized protein n=1 Tax=Daphnia magna TaxID=35525 RepID=A0A162CHR0_9CRUS|nr:Uncharacterized protein APZ42_018438 [Daphnia magna]